MQKSLCVQREADVLQNWAGPLTLLFHAKYGSTVLNDETAKVRKNFEFV